METVTKLKQSSDPEVRGEILRVGDREAERKYTQLELPIELI